MKRHYGGPVFGDMFWPRPDIVEPLLAAIGSGESCALFGLRRTGKSSVLEEITRRLRASGDLTVVHVDVQGLEGLDQLFLKLIEALPGSTLREGLLQRLSGNAGITKLVRGLVDRWLKGTPATANAEEGRAIIDYWSLIVADIEKAIVASGRRWVLIVDEFPFLMENMLRRGAPKTQIEALLATLRGWHQRAGVVVVLAGSIGMQWLVRDHGIQSAHLNDFVPFPVPPLSEDAARDMLAALVAAQSAAWWTEETTGVFFERVAALYPSFIQFAFGRVTDRNAATRAAVDHVFDTIIGPQLDETFFNQFRDRLGRYDETTRRAAQAAIHVAVVQHPMPAPLDAIWTALDPKAEDATLAERCLHALQEDGFLVANTRLRVVSVSSPLVVAWWNSRPRRPR